MTIKEKIEHFVLDVLVIHDTPEVDINKKHIACIGDSITFGAGVGGIKNETWEHFLEEKIGNEYQVLNYGISGRTLQDEGDYPYTKEEYFKISQDINADIYLIMLGTNDTKPFNWNEERFKKEFYNFVSTYINLENKPKVILMTPPACFPEESLKIVAFEINEEIISGPVYDIVKKCAKDYNLQLIDLYNHTKDHSEWFIDGVHPNIHGNKEFAEFIYQNIKEIL